MLLQADQMIYDNQNNRVIARGNVEIYYNTYTLLADKVVYDRGRQSAESGRQRPHQGARRRADQHQPDHSDG